MKNRLPLAERFAQSGVVISEAPLSASEARRNIGISGFFDQDALFYMTKHRGSVPSDFEGTVKIDTNPHSQDAINLDTISTEELITKLHDIIQCVVEPREGNQLDYIVNLLFAASR